jgi:hypothetical protein
MNDVFKPSQLLLEQFREIAYLAPTPIRWIVVWILLYLEPIYINYVTHDTVDTAIKDYHKQMDVLEPLSYTIESNPSEVEGLDELRIYYDPKPQHRNTAQK